MPTADRQLAFSCSHTGCPGASLGVLTGLSRAAHGTLREQSPNGLGGQGRGAVSPVVRGEARQMRVAVREGDGEGKEGVRCAVTFFVSQGMNVAVGGCRQHTGSPPARDEGPRVAARPLRRRGGGFLGEMYPPPRRRRCCKRSGVGVASKPGAWGQELGARAWTSSPCVDRRNYQSPKKGH